MFDQIAATIARQSEEATRLAMSWTAVATTETGKVLQAIAENPAVESATTLPLLDRLRAFLGEADGQRAIADVERLLQENPGQSPAEIAQNLVGETALKAAGIGLVTDLVPDFALSLLAIDLAATTQLQIDLVYRLAALYGEVLDDPARRGEAIALLGLALGGEITLKPRLGALEWVPGTGPAVDAAINALLTYGLGLALCQYYARRNADISA